MIRVGDVAPQCPDHIHRMAAEILACRERDPLKRRAHRQEKLASFPEADRDEVRAVVNRVIQARLEEKQNR